MKRIEMYIRHKEVYASGVLIIDGQTVLHEHPAWQTPENVQAIFTHWICDNRPELLDSLEPHQKTRNSYWKDLAVISVAEQKYMGTLTELIKNHPLGSEA